MAKFCVMAVPEFWVVVQAKYSVSQPTDKRQVTARFGLPTHLDTSRCKCAGLVGHSS